MEFAVANPSNPFEIDEEDILRTDEWPSADHEVEDDVSPDPDPEAVRAMLSEEGFLAPSTGGSAPGREHRRAPPAHPPASPAPTPPPTSASVGTGDPDSPGDPVPPEPAGAVADDGSDPHMETPSDDTGHSQYIGTVLIRANACIMVHENLIQYLLGPAMLSPEMALMVLWLLGRQPTSRKTGHVRLPIVVPRQVARAIGVRAHTVSNWLLVLQRKKLIERPFAFRHRGRSVFRWDLTPLGERFAACTRKGNAAITTRIGRTTICGPFLRIPKELIEFLRAQCGLSARATLMVLVLLRENYMAKGGYLRLPTMTRAELAQRLRVGPDTITVLRRELRQKGVIEIRTSTRGPHGLIDEELDLTPLGIKVLEHLAAASDKGP